jgi:hypothetical protein
MEDPADNRPERSAYLMRDSGLRLAQAVLESRKQRIPGLEVWPRPDRTIGSTVYMDPLEALQLLFALDILLLFSTHLLYLPS